MQIDFQIAGAPATFKRSWLTGASNIETSQGVVPVKRARNPSTWFHVGRTNAASVRVGEHDVMIEWAGPPVFRAFVPLRYTILVDGEEVATKKGY
jgi:hypothetical protein